MLVRAQGSLLPWRTRRYPLVLCPLDGNLVATRGDCCEPRIAHMRHRVSSSVQQWMADPYSGANRYWKLRFRNSGIKYIMHHVPGYPCTKGFDNTILSTVRDKPSCCLSSQLCKLLLAIVKDCIHTLWSRIICCGSHFEWKARSVLSNFLLKSSGICARGEAWEKSCTKLCLTFRWKWEERWYR